MRSIASAPSRIDHRRDDRRIGGQLAQRDVQRRGQGPTPPDSKAPMHRPATAPDTTQATRTYPGVADQIAAVRADLRGLLAGCPVADDVILCTSELAANAALHSNSRVPGAYFTVHAEIHPGDYVWIEVEDSGGPWTEAVPDPTRGHGLDIIRSPASDWGIDGARISRVGWARIDWRSA
ncbi:MAG TPA: ATP-binding protein [Terracidiphilus sp.]|nr:ATP-binding protein [Terracidiphilus sp.]